MPEAGTSWTRRFRTVLPELFAASYMVKPRRFDKAWMEALERGVGPCLRAYVRRQMGMTMRCFGLARAARALRPGALL